MLPSETQPPVSTAAPSAVPSPTPSFTPAAPTPDAREFTVNVPKADVWDSPENENEYWSLWTQLILGEKVLVTDRQGEWSRIAAVEQPSSKDPLGYPGWVRTESLAPGWPAARQFAVVMAPRAQLRTEPEGTLLLSIYLDTRLPVESTPDDWIQVRLPDGRSGWLPLRDARMTDDLAAPIPTEGLFNLAQALIGVPYWWGGTTTEAVDCSGFLYRLFHAYGITLSRDADDQAVGGAFVARSDLRKGDLIYSSKSSGGAVSHAAMYWGNNTILDADEYIGVTIRPLSDLFRYEYWITARRFLP